MIVVRPATVSELPIIHRLQDIPYREKVFAEPLPPLEAFVEESAARMSEEREFYYLVEQESTPLGFIEYRSPEQTTSIWGKWLSTLCYACAVLAFEDLKFSNLIWYTRAINKPMLRTCDKMKFRKTGEKSVCRISEGFAFIAIGKLVLFELTPAEFYKNCEWMKALSMPVELRFRDQRETK